MENQLTEHQKHSVFAMYLTNMGQTVQDIHTKREMPLHGISLNEGMIEIESDMSGDSVDWWNTSTCKLILKPLSEISDEDAIEMVFCHPRIAKPQDLEVLKILKASNYVSLEYRYHDSIDELNNEDGWAYSAICVYFNDLSWQQREYAIRSGYAVQLYFCPNHSLNGKTAIDLQIAIENTEIS